MEELIKDVSEKAGITTEQAKVAVEEVTEFFKKQLHDRLSIKITEALTGEPDPSVMEKITEIAQNATHRVGEFASNTQSYVKEKLTETGKEEKVEEVSKKIEELAYDASKKIDDAVAKAQSFLKNQTTYTRKDKDGKDVTGSYMEDVHDKVEDFSEDAKEAFDKISSGASKFFKNAFGKKEDEKKEDNGETKKIEE